MNSRVAKAVLRRLRISPQKLNIVVSMIRGMNVDRAVGVLLYSKKRVATDVRKTLLSAISNAENNHGLRRELLYIKEAYVGYSLKLKRFHPRGRGRGGSVVKPFSHFSVILEERE